MKPLLTSTRRSKSPFRTMDVSLFKTRLPAALVELAGAVTLGTERLVTGNHRDLFVIIPGIAARGRRLHAVQREIVDHAPVFSNVSGPAEEIDRQFPHLGIDGLGLLGAAGLHRPPLMAGCGVGPRLHLVRLPVLA